MSQDIFTATENQEIPGIQIVTGNILKKFIANIKSTYPMTIYCSPSTVRNSFGCLSAKSHHANYFQSKISYFSDETNTNVHMFSASHIISNFYRQYTKPDAKQCSLTYKRIRSTWNSLRSEINLPMSGFLPGSENTPIQTHKAPYNNNKNVITIRLNIIKQLIINNA